jgi:hypothetical protein
LRVAAEVRDVALHPAQRGLLVLQAVVTRLAVRAGQGRVGQEAERAEPVVDRDHGHAVCHQSGGVVVIALAAHQRAAVDPDHDRVAPAAGGREDVQVQAVLRHAGLAERPGHLRAVRRELRRSAHARPARGRLRRLPPQRADRGCGVRDAQEFIDRPAGQAANGPVGGGATGPPAPAAA